MAAIQVTNGEEVVAPVTETEIQIAAGVLHGRQVKFRVVSGTVQVTTGPRGSTGVIGGNIHAYAVSEPDSVTVEPSITSGNASSVYVKGTGTIIFSF